MHSHLTTYGVYWGFQDIFKSRQDLDLYKGFNCNNMSGGIYNYNEGDVKIKQNTNRMID